MFKSFIGKRVIIFVTTPHCINYVGTLESAKGNILKLTQVTPQRETRKMPDMVINFATEKYEKLVAVDDPQDDPSQHQKTP